MLLTDAQKEQVKKDLIGIQNDVLLIQEAAMIPTYLKSFVKKQMRIIETLAIAANAFTVEARDENGG